MSFKEKVNHALENSRLQVDDGSGNPIAILELIVESDLDNQDVIKKITDWRDLYKKCFLTEFRTTEPRTRSWLEKEIVSNPNRILFKILSSETGEMIGHVGAVDRGDYIEFDYFIIHRSPGKNFAKTVAQFFSKWLLESTGLDLVKARVRSDNIHAIIFYLRSGFHLGKQLPLKMIDLGNDELKYETDLSLNESQIYLTEIRICKEDLNKKIINNERGN